jgi:hypothetical protein
MAYLWYVVVLYTPQHTIGKPLRRHPPRLVKGVRQDTTPQHTIGKSLRCQPPRLAKGVRQDTTPQHTRYNTTTRNGLPMVCCGVVS